MVFTVQKNDNTVHSTPTVLLYGMQVTFQNELLDLHPLGHLRHRGHHHGSMALLRSLLEPTLCCVSLCLHLWSSPSHLRMEMNTQLYK
ncbi:hypothetical protein TNCV_653631 [Trichonephila clavipes]|nr:hypothetical protein TNCV_653631 [Trichonephila clavipes]